MSDNVKVIKLNNKVYAAKIIDKIKEMYCNDRNININLELSLDQIYIGTQEEYHDWIFGNGNWFESYYYKDYFNSYDSFLEIIKSIVNIYNSFDGDKDFEFTTYYPTKHDISYEDTGNENYLREEYRYIFTIDDTKYIVFYAYRKGQRPINIGKMSYGRFDYLSKVVPNFNVDKDNLYLSYYKKVEDQND